MIHQYGRDLASLQKLADPLIAVLLLAWQSDLSRSTGEPELLLLFAVVALLISGILSCFGIYRSWRERAFTAVVARVLLAWTALLGILICGLASLQQQQILNAYNLMPWPFYLLGWLLISHALSRLLLRRLRVAGQNSRCDGYIGSIEGYRHLYKRVAQDPWRGHRISPILTWPRDRGPQSNDLSALKRLASCNTPDQWIVEDPGQADTLTSLLSELAQGTCPVLLIPAWLHDHHLRPQAAEVAGLPALQLWATEATPLKLRFKHLADKFASFILLIGLTPVLLILALVIVLDSPGPPLFSQCRYGETGRPFLCLKFRTLHVLENGEDVVQVRRHDPRVTRVGRWLRRLNLDELPQLLNVLRGEMSLVGPRPHAEAHNEYYRTRVDAYMRRHTLRPGITGWAQVLGFRGETQSLEAMDQRVKADLDYIHNWSLLLDLEILLLTLVRWSGRNAF